MKTRGLSKDATDIMMLSWQASTQKQYRAYIRQWHVYASKWNIHRISPLAVEVVEFPTFLYNSNLGYSALNTARSALSTMIICDGISGGKHPLIISLHEGHFPATTCITKE